MITVYSGFSFVVRLSLFIGNFPKLPSPSLMLLSPQWRNVFLLTSVDGWVGTMWSAPLDRKRVFVHKVSDVQMWRGEWMGCFLSGFPMWKCNRIAEWQYYGCKGLCSGNIITLLTVQKINIEVNYRRDKTLLKSWIIFSDVHIQSPWPQ